jgi:hypothetical protein
MLALPQLADQKSLYSWELFGPKANRRRAKMFLVGQIVCPTEYRFKPTVGIKATTRARPWC